MRIYFGNAIKISLAIVAVVAITAGLLGSCTTESRQSVRSADPNLSQSKLAPDFTVTDADGKRNIGSGYPGERIRFTSSERIEQGKIKAPDSLCSHKS